MSKPKYVMTEYPFEDEGKLYENAETLKVALAAADNDGGLENVRVYLVGDRVMIGSGKK